MIGEKGVPMRIAIVVFVMLAGCAGDPADDRFRPGDEAIIAPENASLKRISVTQEPGRKGAQAFLLPGTKVRVVSDSVPAEYTKSTVRDVRIHVLEGESKGTTSYVERMYLRPIEK